LLAALLVLLRPILILVIFARISRDGFLMDFLLREAVRKEGTTR
jgi:hypothetical protein